MTNAAHSAYRTSQSSAPSGRSVEAEAFATAARMLHEAVESPADALKYLRALEFNRKLWSVIEADVSDPKSPLPSEVRQDFLDLAVFVDEQTALAVKEPATDHLDSLIQINRNLATGLFSDPR